MFNEYFHGDNGAGLGASHQTGWTGLVAQLLQFYGTVTDFEAAIAERRAASTPEPETSESELETIYRERKPATTELLRPSRTMERSLAGDTPCMAETAQRLNIL